MTLETEHRGYKIRYSENADEWTSLDAGSGMSAPTLSKLKEKIDRLALSIRKASATACLELDYSTPTVTEVSVIEYLGPKIERGGWNGKPDRISEQKVAAVGTRKGNEKATRRETSLDKMIPDTDEVRAALVQAERAYNAMRDAEAAYRTARAAIPRLTISDIEALVKLSGIDHTGGLKE